MEWLLVEGWESDGEGCEKVMGGMLEIMLIVGIVENRVEVGLIMG